MDKGICSTVGLKRLTAISDKDSNAVLPGCESAGTFACRKYPYLSNVETTLTVAPGYTSQRWY